MQDCLPLGTIVFRIMGEDVADILYADTDVDLRGYRLMQVAMLVLQLELNEVPDLSQPLAPCTLICTFVTNKQACQLLLSSVSETACCLAYMFS